MPRLPELTPAELTPEQAALFRSIAATPRGAKMALEGPFGVWMHSPQIGEAAQRLGQKVRYESALPARLSELAILVCARRWRADYEWHVHAPIALGAGVGDDIVQALRSGRAPVFEAADEAAVYEVCMAVLATSRIPEAVYRTAVAVLGERAVVDLVVLVGYYTLVAFTLNAFEAAPPAPVAWEDPAGPA